MDTDQPADEGTAAGITFALTAEAEPLANDVEKPPCVYCNPEEMVDERHQSAREKMDEILENDEHAESPIPEGVTVRIGFASGDVVSTITGHEINEATGSVQYLTEGRGKANASLLTHVVSVPREYGKVMADYRFVIGHGDGEGVEIYACDMCLNGIPVEWAGQTTRDAMSYEYSGDGNVVTEVREDMSHDRTAIRRKSVDEQGSVVDSE